MTQDKGKAIQMDSVNDIPDALPEFEAARKEIKEAEKKHRAEDDTPPPGPPPGL